MSMGIYLLLILLGLAIGSFVSVITYRIPKGEDFVLGRSYCDSCKKELRWSDNIPLLSFLLYQGKSRCCHKKISLRYPLIELSTVAGFVGLYLAFGFSFLHSAYYILLVLTLSIFVIDVENQVIPDEFTFTLILLGIVLSKSTIIYLFPAFLLPLPLLLLYLITKGKGIGLGDVKLAIPIGLFLGVEKGLISLLLAFIIGGFVSAILLLLRLANLKSKIAFGPFMLVSFWIVLIFGINFY